MLRAQWTVSAASQWAITQYMFVGHQGLRNVRYFRGGTVSADGSLWRCQPAVQLSAVEHKADKRCSILIELR